jgi:hypothetical protein
MGGMGRFHVLNIPTAYNKKSGMHFSQHIPPFGILNAVIIPQQLPPLALLSSQHTSF